MSKFYKIIVVVFISFVYLNTSAQNTVYVSPTGDNANDGSLATPFQTIQHAINNMVPGTTIEIMAGTYQEYLYINNKPGTAALPILITNYNNDLVVIDGQGTSAGIGDILLYMSNSSYITLDSLVIQNLIANYVQGISINGNCNHISITHCVIKDIHFSNDINETVTSFKNSNPLLINATDASAANSTINISNNEVYNCRTGYSSGITLTGNVDSFVVENNKVHDITNIGILVAGHYGICSDASLDQSRDGIVRKNTVYNCKSEVAGAAGIYADGVKDITIENNICYDGQIGFNVGCENKDKQAENIKLLNNITYGNTLAGIVVGGNSYPNLTGKVINSSISGNTTYHNDLENSWTGEIKLLYCENVTVKNNIFYADNPYNVVAFYKNNNGIGNSYDYNLYYSTGGMATAIFSFNDVDEKGFDTYKTNTPFDAHSGFLNPYFLNESGLDFHLSDSSNAINAGDPAYTSVAGQKDMDGAIRIQRTIIAYESAYSLSIYENKVQTIAIYPNPTAGIVYLPAGNYLSYTLTNMQGQEVAKDLIAEGTINIPDLPTGAYLLTVEGKTALHRARVFKN
jgi:hypothetical protein